MSGRRSEGPLLALVVFALILGVLALIIAAVAGPESVRGVALIVLGVGVIATCRAIADVLSGLTRPTPPEWYRDAAGVLVGVIGLAMAGYGAVALL
jgi:hypothetical protein